MMILRDYQKDFVEKTISCVNENKLGVLGVAPTGSGKTIMFCQIIKELFLDGKVKKAIVFAHRDELVSQNRDKFKKMTPYIPTSIFDGKTKDLTGMVVFSMVPSFVRFKEQDDFLKKVDMIVFDEAHHAMARSYLKIIFKAREMNPKVKIFGVTATPQRGDGKGLGKVFDEISSIITVEDLIEKSVLVKPKCFALTPQSVAQDLEEFIKKNKLISDSSLSKTSLIMDTPIINEIIVDSWLKYSKDRKTVIFATTRLHAISIANHFNKRGIKSEALAVPEGDLSKEDRNRILNGFEKGDTTVITNVFIMTEGYDYPPISCICLARPNSYRSTLIQMIGRGLRPADGKEDCMVLDFGDSLSIHGDVLYDVEKEDFLHENESKTKTKEEEKEEEEKTARVCGNCQITLPKTVKNCPICTTTDSIAKKRKRLEEIAVIRKKQEKQEKECKKKLDLKEKNIRKLEYFLIKRKYKFSKNLNERFQFGNFCFFKNLKLVMGIDEYYGFFAKMFPDGKKQLFCLKSSSRIKFPECYPSEKLFDSLEEGLKDFLKQILTEEKFKIYLSEYKYDDENIKNKIEKIKPLLKKEYVEYFDKKFKKNNPTFNQLNTLNILYWLGKFRTYNLRMKLFNYKQ